MAPLEPKAWIVIGLGVIFFVLVGVYYFVKSKKGNQQSAELPRAVTVGTNSIIVIVATTFFLGLFYYFALLFLAAGDISFISELPYLGALLILGWLVYHKKISKSLYWTITIFILGSGLFW